MTILLYISSIALVLTKYADCYTTVSHITHIGDEQNAIARRLMQRYGVKTTVWGVWIVTILLVLLSLYVALISEQIWYHVAYVVIALWISIVQGSVAYTNHTGRYTMVTRLVHHLLRR